MHWDWFDIVVGACSWPMLISLRSYSITMVISVPSILLFLCLNFLLLFALCFLLLFALCWTELCSFGCSTGQVRSQLRINKSPSWFSAFHAHSTCTSFSVWFCYMFRVGSGQVCLLSVLDRDYGKTRFMLISYTSLWQTKFLKNVEIAVNVCPKFVC